MTAEAMLRAGYAAAEITPPVGVDLTGFIARPGPCSGVLDPLQARALVVAGADGSLTALVTCDLIGLGKHLVARVRRQVAAATGLRPEAVLFNCSHTHAGPETGVLTTIGIPHQPYLRHLEAALTDIVVRAAARLDPVRLRLGSTEVPAGLAVNRVYRHVGRPEAYDRQLIAVRFDRAAARHDAPLATVVTFACHAVALGAAETEASADFVAPLRTEVEAAGYGPVLYVNGCGGDVNPAMMDTRGRLARDDLGHGLARAALDALARAEPVDDAAGGGTVAAAQEWVELPLQQLRSAGDAAAILAAGRQKLATLEPGSPRYRGTVVTEIDYPLRLLRLHYGSETVPVTTAEVQALRLGPIAVLALPGEIFSSIGQRIKQASPFATPCTLVAGWANDNVGYVPDRDAYPRGGYEVDSASRYYGHPAGWAPEAGEALVDAAGRALRAVEEGAL